MAWPASVTLREVGSRDGLKGEAPVAIAGRVALIEALIAAGVREIEVASFVSPKAVPSMAGAAEVVAKAAPKALRSSVFGVLCSSPLSTGMSTVLSRPTW